MIEPQLIEVVTYELGLPAICRAIMSTGPAV